MITHHEGKRYSVTYTVEDIHNKNKFVFCGITDTIAALYISKDDAYALLHGGCRIGDYVLIRQDEVEI